VIRPSPELLAVMQRWHHAMLTRNRDTVRNLLSSSAHLRYVGSAESEIWNGAVLLQGFVDHVDEIPDFRMFETLTEAFENGETGWALWVGDLEFASTEGRIPHRFTFVFALENGAWKIVQMHCSNPIPNVEKYGVEHTAIENLLAAARDGFRIDQKQGMATIMFTDIADSSAIAQAVGDQIWAGLIADHIAALTRLIEAAGGTVVKSLGDGTMSTFVSARDALTTAAGIQQEMQSNLGEPPLRVRIGLHSGDVIQTRDDFFGTVVNKAARIASAARPDEVRLSVATQIMAGTEQFTYANPVTVPLKGLEGDHLLYRLEWTAG
jgi:class 3 adenylate cyclase